MNNQFAKKIKEMVKFPELLNRYGFTVKNGRMACPIHKGKNPNFGVKDDFCHCFKCDWSGDIIDFTKDYFGISFAEACQKLNDDFFLGLPIGQSIYSERAKQIAKECFLKKQEQKKKIEFLHRLQDAVFDAHDSFRKAFEALQEFKPVVETDKLDPRFVKALNDIEYARYLLGVTQEELIAYEKRIG